MDNATPFGIYKRIIVSLFLLLSANAVLFSQELPVKFSSDREEAFHHIKSLKSGSLVVRLNSQDRKITAYRAAGKKKFADKLERELEDFNKNLVQAFQKFFTFSNVYFIRPEDYELVRNEVPSGYFLNENLAVDSSITLSFEESYFFCEYGPVYAESLENSNESRRKMVTSTPVQQEALVIKDYSLTQLISPFPNHVSIRLKDIEKVVEKLNKNLRNFYKAATN